MKGFEDKGSHSGRLSESFYSNASESELNRYREMLKKGLLSAVRKHNLEGLESFIENSEALNDAQIQIELSKGTKVELARILSEREVIKAIQEVTGIEYDDYNSAINSIRKFFKKAVEDFAAPPKHIDKLTPSPSLHLKNPEQITDNQSPSELTPHDRRVAEAIFADNKQSSRYL